MTCRYALILLDDPSTLAFARADMALPADDAVDPALVVARIADAWRSEGFGIAIP